jgi:oligoribonuclease
MAGSDVLVWIDMEMTGLDANKERIIEVAAIMTDGQLTELATGPDLVIHQPDDVLAAMDEWNRTHHTASGLVDRVKASTVTEAEAEALLLAFVNVHVPSPKDRPVLAGNSIHQDRRFIRRYMPKLDARLHYRMVDVSTIKELARRWFPQIIARQPQKKDTHRALDDIRESIDELRYYRAHVFAPAPTAPAPTPGAPAPSTPAAGTGAPAALAPAPAASSGTTSGTTNDT